MDLEFSSAAVRGLTGYVQRVATALGLSGHGFFVQTENPANAYLALDTRAPRFPTRDAALVWDEVHGWAAALERHSGEDLVILSYLGDDVLPAPEVVAKFTHQVLAGIFPDRTTPTILRAAGDDDGLPARLARYAGVDAGAGGRATALVD